MTPPCPAHAPARAVSPRIADLVARRAPGYTLEGPFFGDEEIYRLDLDRIWRRGWLFAGHSCEIPEVGDYLTMDVGPDPLLIIRGATGEIRGLHNVCRHRGSLLCTEESGNTGKRIVCPYHQWSYDLDGALAGARGMPDGFDRSGFGLLPVHLRELSGMIFVSMAEEPPDFVPARRLMGPAAAPQGFDRAKVAWSADYLIEGNWKLVWENNRECFHCNANHPQYIKANFDHYNADDTTPAIRKRIEEAVRRSEEKWAADGLAVTHASTGMATFPDPENGVWYSANRTALAEGFVTESLDGRQVAPLMGNYADPDVGTLRLRTLPNFWNHSSCDHAVSTRLLPAGPMATRARVTWLVDREAVEGRDYRLEDLLPFWKRTSEQDWEIVKNAQRGVNSIAYRPGPYSPAKEYNVDAFVRWYLGEVGG